MTDDPAGDTVIVSYLTLRRIVGVLGMGLPVIVAVWGFILQSSAKLLPSISDYYGLRTRDAFVGILFTIAWFLYTYHGYERKDNVAGNLACLFALAVALSPNSGSTLEQIIHFAAATCLFLALAYFCLFLFTKSGGQPTPRKLLRNRVYRICGIAMLICIAFIAVFSAFLKGTWVATLNPVFWLETLALWAFGFSWFVKGEAIFRDLTPA